MTDNDSVRRFANTGTPHEDALKLVRRANSRELDDMLQSVPAWPDRHNLALNEQSKRRHRLLIAIAVVTAILAAIAAAPVVRTWLFPARPAAGPPASSR